jgi:type IV pilus biogenesis protein CpaD/CtpE
MTLGVTVCALAACSTTPAVSPDPNRVIADYGNSVHNMILAQTYNPEAANNPPKNPPLVFDGQKAEKVIGVYREHKPPAKPESSINILNIGSGGGSQ